MEKAIFKNFKGLTSYQLKILGIILMVFDHIHQMFYMNGVPMWFTGVGRLVAPIFLFLSAEGFYYTKNKKKYMARLWIAYILMSACSIVIQKVMPLDSVILMNSIFGTIFLGLYYMYFIDIMKLAIKDKNFKKIILSILAFLLPFLLGALILFSVSKSVLLMQVLAVIFPTPILVEGGVLWIALAVLFYLLRDKKLWIRMMPLILMSVFVYVTGNEFQSLMLLSIVPISMYNGKPGRKGSKYFFYIFYPAHIYLLYTISYFINK